MNFEQALEYLSKETGKLHEVYLTVKLAYARRVEQVKTLQEKIKLQDDRIEKREDELIAKEAELSRLKQMIIAWSLADDPGHPDVTALADEAYKMMGDEL